MMNIQIFGTKKCNDTKGKKLFGGGTTYPGTGTHLAVSDFKYVCGL